MARILLAEPDRAIRDFIAGILAEFGHDVKTCENGIEAMVWLTAAPFDVLITDLMLHGDQGLILSRHSAALGIRTITLTGREFQGDAAEQGRLPALLEKPFRFSDLRRVLHAVEPPHSLPPLRNQSDAA